MNNSHTKIVLIQNIDELQIAYGIRRQVFMEEGGEPEEEQFDGNDLCASHLLAYWKDKPAGTMRLRVVSGSNGGTIMWERLAIPKHISVQNPWMFRSLLNSARHYTRFMGIHTVIGIVEDPRLMRVWKRYGSVQTGEEPLTFRGHKYVPIRFKMDGLINTEDPSLRRAVMATPETFEASRQNLE